MGTYIKDTTCKKSQPSPVGIRLKAELKKRGFSQKSFAELLGMSPSHLSDIVRGNRPLSLKTAVILQNLLGIPAKDWMDLQISHKLEGNSDNNSEGFRDAEEIAAYDQVICVKTLLKKANISAKGNRECLDVLRHTYQLPSPEKLKNESEMLKNGFFRKSAKTGLDERMIATWVVLARSSVREQKLYTQFDGNTLSELADLLSHVFNSNSNTIIRTHDVLAKYGIKFSVVERLDHASIDGYSFVDGDDPAIVITKRYDRIDNFAFSVLHEIYHVYNHLNGNCNQMISIVDYDTESAEEKEANDFASRTLVSPDLWFDAPTVQLNKPWIIQKRYSSWAEDHHLNKWIVLGQISHITGMYKFKSDDSRKIH